MVDLNFDLYRHIIYPFTVNIIVHRHDYHHALCYDTEYIVHGSKNQIDSSFFQLLWSDFFETNATFRSANYRSADRNVSFVSKKSLQKSEKTTTITLFVIILHIGCD